MSAAFERAWFDAAGSVGHLVGGAACQGQAPECRDVAAGPGGPEHPGGQDALAGQGKAPLPWLAVVRGGGGGDDLAAEVVSPQGPPEFPADQGRGLAPQRVQMQGLLDDPNIQFGVPALAVEGGELFLIISER